MNETELSHVIFSKCSGDAESVRFALKVPRAPRELIQKHCHDLLGAGDALRNLHHLLANGYRFDDGTESRAILGQFEERIKFLESEIQVLAQGYRSLYRS